MTVAPRDRRLTMTVGQWRGNVELLVYWIASRPGRSRCRLANENQGCMLLGLRACELAPTKLLSRPAYRSNLARRP